MPAAARVSMPPGESFGSEGMTESQTADIMEDEIGAEGRLSIHETTPSQPPLSSSQPQGSLTVLVLRASAITSRKREIPSSPSNLQLAPPREIAQVRQRRVRASGARLRAKVAKRGAHLRKVDSATVRIVR